MSKVNRQELQELRSHDYIAFLGIDVSLLFSLDTNQISMRGVAD